MIQSKNHYYFVVVVPRKMRSFLGKYRFVLGMTIGSRKDDIDYVMINLTQMNFNQRLQGTLFFRATPRD